MIAEQVKSDLTAAMKAGDKERVGALRFVLSALQLAAKEGDDEIAVLRRERKRRHDAAEQYREAGRGELAAQEERESALIDTYLPAELDDVELEQLVADAIEQSGAATAKDMGRVMSLVMGAVEGRADGKRVSAKVKDALSA